MRRSLTHRPLAADLFTGLHGWAAGLISAGFRVVGYDIEDMSAKVGEPKPEHFELVLQDVLTIHGSQFKDAELIVASPPCQEYSYMAMPWSRAKQIQAAILGKGEFPEGYNGSRNKADLTRLFRACFRLQEEASAEAGRRIPLVVENVAGAQKWVGRSAWNFGSFHLWGDVPALMPMTGRRFKSSGMNWSDQTIRGQDFTRLAAKYADDGLKLPGNNAPRRWDEREVQRLCDAGRELSGEKHKDRDGYDRTHPEPFGWKAPRTSSKSSARKAASAKIARIPFALAHWIGRCYYPKVTA